MSKKISKVIKPILSVSFAISCAFIAQGENWVRITVEKDGIYSVSYNDLKNMGFSDPAKVGVLGLGGTPLPVKLETLYPQDFKVPVILLNDRLYFYGKGPEDISFTKESDKSYFKNNGRNIYTDTGYYYLTDTEGFQIFPDKDNVSEENVQLNKGVRYLYHEKDLYHNITDSGNIFWGEALSDKQPKLSWPLNLLDLSDNQAIVDIALYAVKGNAGNYIFSTSIGNDKREYPNVNGLTSNFNPLSIPLFNLNVGKGNETFGIQYQNLSGTEGANLDYWVISYNTDLSNLDNINLSPIAFPTLNPGETGLLKMSDSDNKVVLDITDYSQPVLLNQNSKKDGFLVSCKKEVPVIAVFDSSKDALKISDYIIMDHNPMEKTLKNQNFDDYQLLIITPKGFIETAEAIASFHRDWEGLNTYIVTIDEIYEEFSAGLPDPESYRRFIKSFIGTGSTLKNVLLIGPMSNDIRIRQKNEGYAGAHIIPQAKAVHFERGAYPAIDYFVSMNDSPDFSKIEKEHLSAGIGILPFINNEEGFNYVEKLKKYVEDPSHFLNLNEWLFIGGIHDEHTHDQQCVTLAKTIGNTTDDSMIVSVVAVDAYGYENAKNKVLYEMNSGKGLTLYFGHAAFSMFGQDLDFINSEDILNLKNPYPYFLITAGCSITVSDKGIRGLGEDWILGTKNGAVGGIISLRETWSGQNYDFVNTFTDQLIKASSNGQKLTIGEIFMNAKNIENNTNDLSLNLICDPALSLPLPSLSIEMSGNKDIKPGEEYEISGIIKDKDGKELTDFNGKIALKIIEPPVTLRSEDLLTSGENGDVTLDVVYADNIISTYTSEVINGKFALKLIAPVQLSSFNGKETRIHASAYNDVNGIGAVGRHKVNILSANNSNELFSDKQGPVIDNIWLDEQNNCVFINANDESGLSMNTEHQKVSINGHSSAYISLSPYLVNDDSKKVVYRLVLPDLAARTHRIEISLNDIFGNSTSEGFDIDLSGNSNNIILSLNQKVAHGEAEFKVVGEGNNFVVDIYDTSWNKIRSLQTVNGMAKWDGRDSSGNSINDGLYKAVVIEKGSNSLGNKYSKVIYVPFVNY